MEPDVVHSNRPLPPNIPTLRVHHDDHQKYRVFGYAVLLILLLLCCSLGNTLMLNTLISHFNASHSYHRVIENSRYLEVTFFICTTI